MSLLESLHNVRPTKEREMFENANGNISVFGTYKDNLVKLYQPFDKGQISLRVKIDDSTVGKYFPKVIAYDDKFIIEEYIKSFSFSKNVDWSEVYTLILKLREIQHEPTFDYLQFIYNRAGKVMPSEYYELDTYVNHNDLGVQNILYSEDGQMKIIDNEHLGCNTGWFLNLFNSNHDLIDNQKNTDEFYGDFSKSLARDIFLNIRKKTNDK